MGNDKFAAQKFSFSNVGLLPREELLEVKKGSKKFSIGIPKEDHITENRIGLTPEAIEILTNNGHDVYIESDAGEGANYTNTNYSERGGIIVEEKAEIFKSDIILKVAPLTMKEADLLRENQVIISSVHLNSQSEDLIRELMRKKVTAIAFENIKDEHNCYPIVKSMSSIAGTTSVLIAAEYLSNSRGGKGVMLGGITGITPTEVVILGAGTAAEFATRAALGMGAFVKIFDNSLQDLREIQNNIGLRLHTSVFHPQVLKRTLKSADVVIGAIRNVDNNLRFWVTEDMIQGMKKGAVIVDISIDQGGCFETSECRTQKDPVYERFGVIHYCIPNLPSIVSRTASIALSNVLLPLLFSIGESGGIINLIKEDLGVRHGVYIYNGLLTNKYIGKHLDIPYKDIDLLLAAF